jgi:hypothetical protein
MVRIFRLMSVKFSRTAVAVDLVAWPKQLAERARNRPIPSENLALVREFMVASG